MTAMTLAVGHAAAQDRPGPVVSHSQPVAIAEPELFTGRFNIAAIAAADSGYLVAYNGYFTQGLFGRVLDAQGATVGPPFLISATQQSGSLARVVFDGSQYIVAWLSSVEGEAQLWVQRVSPAGLNIGSPQALASAGTESTFQFDLARTESATIVMACTSNWESDNSCRTWTVSDASSTQIDELAMAGGAVGVELESSRGELLAAVATSPGGTTLVRVDDDAMFDATSQATLADVPEQSALAATENGWALLWRQDQDTRLTMLDFDGVLTSSATPLIAANAPSWIQAHAISNGFLVLVREHNSVCNFCREAQSIRRYSPSWEPIETLTEFAELYVLDAAAPANGSRVITLWGEVDRGIVAMTHDLDDFELADEPTPVSQLPSSQEGSRSAAGPGGWLVAWTEYRGVRARRVDAAGAPQGETITIGNVPDDSALKVTEVSGNPQGWLVAWNSVTAGTHVTLLDASGAIRHDIKGLSGERVQAVPSQDGWVLAYNHLDVGGSNGMAVVTRSLAADGSLAEPRIWSELSDNYEQTAFDITPLGEGYRIWWASAGVVRAKNVVGEAVNEAVLPVFDVSQPRWLSATQSSEEAAVTWWSNDGSYLNTSKHPGGSAFPLRWSASELTTIRDTRLVVWTHPDSDGYYGPTELHSVDDALDAPGLVSFANARSPALSAAREDQVLVTFGRAQEVLGSTRERLYASVVTMTEPEAGGAGGAGSTTDDAGAGGVAGTPMGIAGTPVGAAGTPEGDGGRSAGVGGETSGEGPETSGGESSASAGESGEAHTAGPPRTSRGCGCRAVDSSDHSGSPGLLLLAALVARRRRPFRAWAARSCRRAGGW
jgi:MYXO-CTERM domain-containing protein